MDIVVEDGNGLPTANSYLSVLEADDILSVMASVSAWDAQVLETKEALLMWATRLLDQRVTWAGRKFHPTGGLAWPRIFAKDREGFPIDDDVVPKQVKVATAVMANHLLTSAADPEAADGAINLTSLKVDVIQLQFDTDILKQKYPSEIRYILQGLGNVSMGRGGPKYIVLH